MESKTVQETALEIRELSLEELEEIVGGFIIPGDVPSTGATAFKQDPPIRAFARKF